MTYFAHSILACGIFRSFECGIFSSFEWDLFVSSGTWKCGSYRYQKLKHFFGYDFYHQISNLNFQDLCDVFYTQILMIKDTSLNCKFYAVLLMIKDVSLSCAFYYQILNTNFDDKRCKFLISKFIQHKCVQVVNINTEIKKVQKLGSWKNFQKLPISNTVLFARYSNANNS